MMRILRVRRRKRVRCRKRIKLRIRHVEEEVRRG
jgi:hypothetical protein